MFPHILYSLNNTLQNILDLQLLVLQVVQNELMVFLYRIQKTIHAFLFLQNVLSQLTIYYRINERKKEFKRVQTSNLELKFEVNV